MGISFHRLCCVSFLVFDFHQHGASQPGHADERVRVYGGRNNPSNPVRPRWLGMVCTARTDLGSRLLRESSNVSACVRILCGGLVSSRETALSTSAGHSRSCNFSVGFDPACTRVLKGGRSSHLRREWWLELHG